MKKITLGTVSIMVGLMLSGCVNSKVVQAIKVKQCSVSLDNNETCYHADKVYEICGDNGGDIVYMGFDYNYNNVLEENEIDPQKDVILCNGNAGEEGIQGDNGFNSLINSTEIEVNDICISGGVKFDIGLDVNRNDILDTDEVTQTRTICLNVNGTPADEQFTKIHEVQGSGASSPMLDQVVTIEAIVTADYQSSDGLKGFYMQEEDVDRDNNDETSEGIFIYDTSHTVQVGDKVKVTGKVVEFYNLTEIKNVSEVIVRGSGEVLPSESNVSLPMTSATEYEKYEGMLVSFPQTLVTTDLYNLSKYGEVLLSSSDKLWTGTQVALPGVAALSVENANTLNQIILDDASTAKYPEVIKHPGAGLSKDNVLRGGDTVTSLKGIMSYGYNKYRIQPLDEVTFVKANARSSELPSVKGDVIVASINVLNYFRTIDDGNNVCGTHTQGCRGADSLEELERQTAKLKVALEKMDADIIGLMEIENDGGVTAAYIASLLPGYDYVRNPDANGSELGTDVITVAMIYKTNTVVLLNGAKTIKDGQYQGAFDTGNRKPLAQTFKVIANNEVFTVINNHFKSKGSGSGLDADQRDGQGKSNYTRTKGAEDLITWITDLTQSIGDEDYLIIGDLNAYAKEDPIRILENGGFTNLDERGNQYSYVYYGQWGTLDYAFANSTLSAKVSDVKRWHINTDESWVFDYNKDATDKSYGRPKPSDYLTNLYEANAFRMSDHDPIIIGFNFTGTVIEDPDEPLLNRVFFSEYVEGSRYNKAVEIYNGSDVDIILSDYKIMRYSNGVTTGTAISLDNITLAVGEVHVLVHSGASDGLKAYVNQESSALSHNGDDALALVSAHTNVLLDVIGQIGMDPGSAWGSADITTKNHTLRRKTNIKLGDTNGTDLFEPSIEWEGHVKDTFTGLGIR